VTGDARRRLGGLTGQLLDLGGDDRKAAASFAGARGFNGGVQREKVRLAGDLVDKGDDIADLVGGIGQRADLIGGAIGLDDCSGCNTGGFRDLPGDFANGRGEFSRNRSNVWTFAEV